MPESNDPDDYIKQNGKENFLSLLKEKEIIQNYIWNYHLKKINRNNPFEVSKFEKEIKKMCYLIKDETLKKYVLEDFLEKIKKLTPIQNTRKNYQRFQRYQNKQNYQILNETKTLHQKKSHFSKIQIKEFSVLFIMLNYLDIASKKIEDISEIAFLSEKNEGLKKLIITSLLEGDNKEMTQLKISTNYKKLIKEIQENSSIQIIVKAKDDEAVLELLNELLFELKELNNLKKIESLEKELINNLDENSYSELIKLKSQLNRE
jgi:DNA primase